jgi:hypothetical protein
MTETRRLTEEEDLDRRSKYTGQLAEPIYEPIYMGLLNGILPDKGSPKAKEARRRGLERVIGKISSLMKWHGVDPTSEAALADLAFALALTHVPGMRIVHKPRPKRGRRRNWKAGLGIELLREVESLRQSQLMTYQDAIRKLRKDKSKGWGRYSEANLITRHREARKEEKKRRSASRNLLVNYQLQKTPSRALGGLLSDLMPSPTATDENA